jgi:hypothetical protein
MLPFYRSAQQKAVRPCYNAGDGREPPQVRFSSVRRLALPRFPISAKTGTIAIPAAAIQGARHVPYQPAGKPKMNRRLPQILFMFIFGWSNAALNAADRTATDPFGIVRLAPTAKGGREWFAEWKAARSVGSYKQDAKDPLFKNSEGTLSIKGGIATAPPGRTRFFVLTPKDQAGRYSGPQWKNVEMTVYFRSGAPTQSSAGQAIDLSARSGERHSDDAPCEGTSYHASLRLDGKCGFKKEVWHTGGYSDLMPVPVPKPWSHVPQNQWIGMKFLCRNCDGDKHVRLQLYVDLKERNDWQLIAEMTDRGGWEGKQEGCNRPKDFILSNAYPAVYFRTDFVPLEAKKFSVREIDPLP